MYVCMSYDIASLFHVMCCTKVNPAASLDKICLLGCGIPTGILSSLSCVMAHC